MHFYKTIFIKVFEVYLLIEIHSADKATIAVFITTGLKAWANVWGKTNATKAKRPTNAVMLR